MPSMPGMFRSQITTSIGVPCRIATAASALPAVLTLG